jgi:hypothetical protein
MTKDMKGYIFTEFERIKTYYEIGLLAEFIIFFQRIGTTLQFSCKKICNFCAILLKDRPYLLQFLKYEQEL